MKKITPILIALILAISLPLFAGCSNSPTAINMSTYYKSTISANIVGSSTTTSRTLTLDYVISEQADTSKMDKYLDFEITANANWIYKMYIEKIEFYVITNETSTEQMTLSLKVSNLAKETNISSIDTFNEIKAHTPEAFKAQKYTFTIGQTVASGTGSTISIDISESSELLLNKNNPESNFKWMIYGLKVYGEHREYSK